MVFTSASPANVLPMFTPSIRMSIPITNPFLCKKLASLCVSYSDMGYLNLNIGLLTGFVVSETYLETVQVVVEVMEMNRIVGLQAL